MSDAKVSNSDSNNNLTNEDIKFLESKTNYKDDRILEFHKLFITQYPYGFINREEFKYILKKLLQATSEQNENNSSLNSTASNNSTDKVNVGTNEDIVFDRLFEMCDVDSNGFIDFKEYLVLFWSRANGSIKEKLEFIFDIYDSDHSNYIDFYELHKIVKILYKLKTNNDDCDSKDNENHFNNYYKVNNANKTRKNLLTPSYYLTFEIMKKFDVSRNGKLSKEEFIDGCLNHEHIRKFLTPLDLLQL